MSLSGGKRVWRWGTPSSPPSTPPLEGHSPREGRHWLGCRVLLIFSFSRSLHSTLFCIRFRCAKSTEQRVKRLCCAGLGSLRSMSEAQSCCGCWASWSSPVQWGSRDSTGEAWGLNEPVPIKGLRTGSDAEDLNQFSHSNNNSCYRFLNHEGFKPARGPKRNVCEATTGGGAARFQTASQVNKVKGKSVKHRMPNRMGLWASRLRGHLLHPG